MFSGDPWSRLLSSAESECITIAENIRQRDQHQRGSRAYIRSNDSIKDYLKKVHDHVRDLKECLETQAIVGDITEDEFNRRRGLLQRLESRFEDLTEQSKTNAREEYARKELYSNRQPEVSASWASPQDTPVEQRLQAQQQFMHVQDEGLDQLVDIMARTKGIAQNFTTELDIHNEVLDDIDNQMGNVNTRLLRNTQRTDQLNQKSGTCYLWMIIIGLFIAILLVAILL